jgi:hypothetical protein
MPPFSKDEVLVLNGVRGERTMCPRAWKVESLLEKAKRHRLCPPEQKWEVRFLPFFVLLYSFSDARLPRRLSSSSSNVVGLNAPSKNRTGPPS